MIDIHCHILHGLDDGAKDLSEALEIARIAVDDGVQAIVATPHMMPDGPMANRREIVMERYAELLEALRREQIPLEVHPGGEVHIGFNVPGELAGGSLLTVADGGVYALIELPSGEIPTYSEQLIFECQLRGVTPIIAHPERNARKAGDLERLGEWIARGVLLQVNAQSLLGISGTEIERSARELVARRFAHFVASDAHSTVRRPPRLAAARAVVERLAGSEHARILFEENPRRAVAGEPVIAWEPLPPLRRGFFDRLLRRSG